MLPGIQNDRVCRGCPHLIAAATTELSLKCQGMIWWISSAVYKELEGIVRTLPLVNHASHAILTPGLRIDPGLNGGQSVVGVVAGVHKIICPIKVEAILFGKVPDGRVVRIPDSGCILGIVGHTAASVVHVNDGIIAGIAISGIQFGHPHPGDKFAGTAIVGFDLKIQIAGRCAVTGYVIEPPEDNVPTPGMFNIPTWSGLQPAAGQIDQDRKIRQVSARATHLIPIDCDRTAVAVTLITLLTAD